MAHIPYITGLESNPFYQNQLDIFPNRMYRQQHPRHHDALSLNTLGLLANLGLHGNHRADDLIPLSTKKDLFEAHIDVGRFQPEELSVKVIDHCVVIEGKHEEREDEHHGYISRHFVRRYELPKDYDADRIVSTLSAEGVLTVRAPRPTRPSESGEIVVPIQINTPSKLLLQNGQKNAEKEKDDEKKN